MLLDTASLYFRAYFGVPETMTAPDGTPVNAVRGFLDFVARLVETRRPTRLVACLDYDWRPAFRIALLPTYKAHRVVEVVDDVSIEETPDTLSPQVPIIVETLAALGMAAVGVDGYEADDVIGTYATHSATPVDVVTGDRDLFQLIDDARDVVVLYTARGVARNEVLDEAAVTERYSIPGRAYADFATLRGDPSDGLPGVAGVGDKTAASLITRFGSLDGILAAMDDPASSLSAPERRKLDAAREYLAVAPDVVRVATDLDVPPHGLDLPHQPADPDALEVLAARWGIESSIRRVLSVLPKP
jgi:5'-3' exonuclease